MESTDRGPSQAISNILLRTTSTDSHTRWTNNRGPVTASTDQIPDTLQAVSGVCFAVVALLVVILDEQFRRAESSPRVPKDAGEATN